MPAPWRTVLSAADSFAASSSRPASAAALFYRPAEGLLARLSGQAGQLKEYHEKVKNFNENPQKVREYLQQSGAKQQPDPEEQKRKAQAEGYFHLSAQDLLTKHPRWLIRRLTVSGVEIRPELPTFCVEGENLSSHPTLVPEPMRLQARPDPQAIEKWKASLAGRTNGETKKENSGSRGLLDVWKKK